MERNDPGPSAAGWAVSAQPFGWWQSGLSKAIRGPSVLSIHFKVLSNGVDGCSSSREPAAAQFRHSGLSRCRWNWKRQQPLTCQAFVGDQVTRRRYWARSMVGWRRFCRAVPNDVTPAGIGFTQPVVSPCAALFGQGRARRRSCRVRPGDVPPFGQRRAARAQYIPQGCV